MKMQETVLARLESARKELLDLGLRNPLLNYKVPRAKGLHIVQEKSVAVYDLLVRQGKAMSFLGRPGGDNTDGLPELPQLSDDEQEVAFNDTKLQTNEFDSKLQTKLLNTYSEARTSLEEKGVNTLYLTLGMLHWCEKGKVEEMRKAPILLVPVSLDRSSAQERFRLRYTQNEIGANLSLQAKMLADFNLSIPDLAEMDDFDLDMYFADIERRIGRQEGWSFVRDEIELGFFSFGKFMIYHDLDVTEWPEGEKPYDHKVIQALFTDGFKELQPTFTEDHHLDKETNADELFYVVDADSSQILAMLAVNEGRNLVIQGPPGTGKSQTITNIIANAIGRGQKVLFVAEKMAALEVVKRRLDSIHLGEACLELHSHKANKKDLHSELRRVLDLGKPTLADLEREISLLDDYKDELNEYSNAVNGSIAKSGLSPNKIMGLLLALEENSQGVYLPTIDIPNIDRWDADTMHKAEAAVDKIEAKLRDTGTPSEMLFWGSQLTIVLPHEESVISNMFFRAKSAVESLKQKGKDIAEILKLDAPTVPRDVEKLLTILELAAKSPGLTDVNISSKHWILRKEDLKDLIGVGSRLSELYKLYQDILLPEAWGQDVLEMRRNILAYGDKWYKFVVGSYNKSVKQLALISKHTLPKDSSGKLELVDAILEAKRLETSLKENEELAKDVYNGRWKRVKSDWGELQVIYNYLIDVHQHIIDQHCDETIIPYLSRLDSSETVVAEARDLKNLLSDHASSIKAVMERLSFTEAHRFESGSSVQTDFDDQLILFTSWIERFPEIHQVTSWNNIVEVVKQEGFECLVSASVNWAEAKDFLKAALQKTWFEFLIEYAFTTSPALRKFNRASHEEIVTKFKDLDLRSFHYNRARVALKHWENVPRQDAGGQVNILRTEFNRKVRHMPIRKLVQQAGLAIQAIKPVFMMSPLSIANFLAPGSIKFDLVIFDEASQVRPVEALGAILRGKQLIVVGDSKQLPPTSFFDTSNKDVDDEENVTSDLQSILGMCDGQGTPQRMLRWHYRSRHESLISLSNQQFYENRLVIFPSPGSKYRMGLSYRHLPDAVYDRGKTRTNPIEAETVADAVMEHAHNNPKQTLGVVAFSTQQMQAILLALELRRRKHPESEAFFRSHAHEPFFVKNLENVQGDERDVIFISVGYGKIEDGSVPMNFGPLNNEGGERRLNVLITRAKSRCEVFANITARDIDLSRSNKFGIRSLKSFLYFAEHGKLDVAEEDKLPLNQPFEDVISTQLQDAGYIVRRQIGSAGFYVDLAVVDPEHPGRYLVGIQCDGQSYANAKSARDRDRLRSQVLEAMGWKMYQVWSADWFKNSRRELSRLIEFIEKARSQVALDDFEEEERQHEVTTLLREHVQEVSILLPEYECAVLPAEVASAELHLHPLGKLSHWMEEVVKVESPVHFEEAARRVVKAAGLAQLGSRIRESLLTAVQNSVSNGAMKIKGDFLWHPLMENPVIRERSKLPSNSRKIQYISPEEMGLAVKKVVESSIAISADAAVPFVAKLFGFNRATEEMRKQILKAVDLAVEKGMVKKDGELLKA